MSLALDFGQLYQYLCLVGIEIKTMGYVLTKLISICQHVITLL